MLQPQALISSETTKTAETAETSKKQDSRIDNAVKDELGKDSFFELLVTQLRHQDPMEPMDNREFISQLAQFSSLEQMQQMNENMISFLDSRNIAENANLIGKNIEVNGEDEEGIQGKVKQIMFEEDDVFALLTDDTRVNIEDIDKIE